MPTISELVPLLYRARRLEWRLSGEVRSYYRDDVRDGSAEQAGPGDAGLEWSGHLDAAPGGRYRADLTDEEGDRQVYDGSSGSRLSASLLIPPGCWRAST